MRTIAPKKDSSVSAFFAVFAVTLLLMLVVSNVQLIDPLVRHDDFPVLLADPAEYYEKTLSEGRWINWLWTIRPFGGPAPMYFLLYLSLWSLFCAAAAINALGRSTSFSLAAPLALLISVAPPGFMISLWFNTTLPSLLLVTLYALLSLRLGKRPLRRLLVLFVPLGLMTYTTHPILMLLICLTRAEDERNLRDLAGILLHFVAGFALGILIIYSLNWWIHDVFGVEVSPWRNPRPPHDIASTLENLRLAGTFFAKLLLDFSHESVGFCIFQLFVAISGFFALMRQDPWRAIYLAIGLAAGIGLMTLQIVVTGVLTPSRAAIFLWVVYAFLFMHLFLSVRENSPPLLQSALRISLITVIAVNAMQGARQYFAARTWQAETRKMAASLPPGAGHFFVLGDIMAMKGAKAAGIQGPRALRMRLRYLTGETFVMCEESPVTCGKAFENGPPPRVIDLPKTAEGSASGSK